MTQELTNIIELLKAEEFNLAYELLKGDPSIYEDCSDDEFFIDFYNCFGKYDDEDNDERSIKWRNNCNSRKDWIEFWFNWINRNIL